MSKIDSVSRKLEQVTFHLKIQIVYKNTSAIEKITGCIQMKCHKKATGCILEAQDGCWERSGGSSWVGNTARYRT